VYVLIILYLCRTLIKKAAHIIFSAWLSLLLLFGTTPKEFIHNFASHTDTIDAHLPAKGFVADVQHHHCSFISFHLLPFENGTHLPSVQFTKKIFCTYTTTLRSQYIQHSLAALTLRGPPTA
jgi:hypothetical protein